MTLRTLKTSTIATWIGVSLLLAALCAAWVFIGTVGFLLTLAVAVAAIWGYLCIRFSSERQAANSELSGAEEGG